MTILIPSGQLLYIVGESINFMNFITIIIVHWNTPELLKKLLILLKPEQNLGIIVVDNKSEKSVDWVKKDFPNITLIKNSANQGYAGGCNSGVKKAKGNWLLFLNPDVLITNKQIFAMADQAEKNNLDAASPNPGSNNYQKTLPSWFSLLIEFTPLNKLYNFKNFISLRTLFGGCLLIKNKVLKQIGGWDERFFLWFEDSDLTKRLYDNNYRVGWLNIKVNHIGGASFKRLGDKNKRKIFFTSMDIYAKKYFSIVGRLVVFLLKIKYLL